MADNVHELRPKIPDTEKITINLGYVDLGHVDLMVRKVFTRTVPTSSERQSRQLERLRRRGQRSTARKVWTSVCGTTAARIFETARRAGEMLHIVCWSRHYRSRRHPRLARATIASVAVLGLHASSAVKAASQTGCGEAMLKQDIVREATRLTRAGQLVSHRASSARMLRGEPRQGDIRHRGPIALTGASAHRDAKANFTSRRRIVRA